MDSSPLESGWYSGIWLVLSQPLYATGCRIGQGTIVAHLAAMVPAGDSRTPPHCRSPCQLLPGAGCPAGRARAATPSGSRWRTAARPRQASGDWQSFFTSAAIGDLGHRAQGGLRLAGQRGKEPVDLLGVVGEVAPGRTVRRGVPRGSESPCLASPRCAPAPTAPRSAGIPWHGELGRPDFISGHRPRCPRPAGVRLPPASGSLSTGGTPPAGHWANRGVSALRRQDPLACDRTV